MSQIHAKEPPGTCTVITVIFPGAESHWQMISYVIILEPRLCPSSSQPFFLSSRFIRLHFLCSFSLFLPLPRKPDKVHIRMQRSQPQGHLLSWPGAALSLGSNLSCYLTSSKKAQTDIFLHLSPDNTL
jgi:hypothetical protein